MCMNTQKTEGQKPTSNDSMNNNTESLMGAKAHSKSSSEDSPSCHNNNDDIIEFGPIKVKPRRKPALTLSTGRRSKYEVLSQEEDYKRDVRRARNRAAAERVRINRLNIEQQLQNQINELEQQGQQLKNRIQMLQRHKLHLESRVFTHDNVCAPTMPLNILNDHISTYPQYNQLPPPPPPTSVSPIQQTVQICDINLDDLFLETPPPPPLQNNDTDILTNMTPDDIEDYLINP